MYLTPHQFPSDALQGLVSDTMHGASSDQLTRGGEVRNSECRKLRPFHDIKPNQPVL